MSKGTIFSILIVGFLLWFLRSAKDDSPENIIHDDYELTQKELIRHVKLAINPSFENWVLFKNGTYIIIEESSNAKQVEELALQLLEEFGPVYAGSPAGDFGTTSLNKTVGWSVSGHGYGMYTYVHPTELEMDNPKDHEIGLYGRKKRDLDAQNPQIIFTASKIKD